MNDPKNIWQNQEREHPNMSRIELRERLRRLHRSIRLKTAVTLGVCLIALGIFIRTFLRTEQLVGRFGWGLVIAGAIFLLLPLLSENHKLMWSGNLAANAGLTTCLNFYRNMLERQRRLRIGRRRRLVGIGTILLFVGLFVLLIPPFRVFYQSLHEPAGPNLKAWIPLLVILAIWVIAYIRIKKRDRTWLRREFETLEALEQEKHLE
jgi:hypothetical protein